MATATRGWRTESVTIRPENGSPKRRIRIPYQVPDALTRDEALAATGLPAYGDQLVPSSPYRVVDINANCQDGPTNWTVTVDYEVSSPVFLDPNDDPLNQPPIISWGKALRTVTMDRDCENKAVRNAAGDIPNPAPTREIEIETMRITRWEQFYNREQARDYRGHTNSNTFSLGATTVRAGELLCSSILPMEAFTMTVAAIVHMAYDFELLTDLRPEPTMSGAPFDLHIPNVGRWGWYVGLDSLWARGPIVNGDGVPVQQDVYLAMDGKPVDSTLRIGSTPLDGGRFKTETPRETPAALQSGIDTADLVQSPFSSSSARVLLYRRYPQADFSLLAF